MAYLDGVYFRAASSGTGDFVVASAIQGYQTPAAASAVNATVYGYRAESDDLTQWEYGYTTYTVSGTSCSRTVLGNSLGTTAKISFTAAPKVGFTALAEDLFSSSIHGMHNRLINPSGQIWQRANSGAAAITDVTYAFDRWYGLTQSAGVTASQVSHAEDTTPYMMRLSQANATAQRFGLAQLIESYNIFDVRGQAITLSARVRMSASTTLRYAIVEWTGIADLPTKDVVNNWTSGTFTPGNFFISTTTTITATGSVALSANTLTTISLTGTVSSSMGNIVVFFWTDSAQAQNVTLDVSKVQLEVGSTATAYALRDFNSEMTLSRRYYRKFVEPPLRGIALSTTLAARCACQIIPPMRATPTVTLSGNMPLFDGAVVLTASAISSNYTSQDFLEVDLSPTSASMTVGRSVLGYYSSGTAYFTASAEF